MQPWSLGVDAQDEVHPLFGGELGGGGGEFDLGVDVAVHVAGLGDRSVVVDDDLGVGVDLFQFADEGEGFAGISFRITWVADHKGEFGDDAEFLCSLCDASRSDRW